MSVSDTKSGKAQEKLSRRETMEGKCSEASSCLSCSSSDASADDPPKFKGLTPQWKDVQGHFERSACEMEGISAAIFAKHSLPLSISIQKSSGVVTGKNKKN